jgi:hypothetical protein
MSGVVDMVADLPADALVRLIVGGVVVSFAVGVLLLATLSLGQLIAYTVVVAIVAILISEWWRGGGGE